MGMERKQSCRDLDVHQQCSCRFLISGAGFVGFCALQFSSVATAAVLFGALGSWVLSARHWFKGPVRNIDVTTHLGHSILEDVSIHPGKPKTPTVGDGEDP